MRLHKVRIQNFRCVDNSEQFSLDQVTCLVGKNESGKTAILKAIHKLKPDNETTEIFEPSQDYPKRKWRPDVAIPSDPPVIETIWELDDTEVNELNHKYGKGTIPSKNFHLLKGYENKRVYDIQIDEQSLVKHLVTELNATERKPISGVKTLAGLRAGLEGIAQRSSGQEKVYQRIVNEFKSGALTTITHEIDTQILLFSISTNTCVFQAPYL